MELKFVGCAGQQRVGKDVTSDYIAHRLGWGRGAFATKVKSVFCDVFGVDMDFIEKWKVVPEPPPGFDMPVRQALQFIGDGLRGIKGSVWIDSLMNRNMGSMAISDIRYRNELLAVKEHGGVNILIHRPGYLNDDPNQSEAQIRPFVEHFLLNGQEGKNDMEGDHGLVDFFIVNDGNLERLYSKIDRLVLPALKDTAMSFSR